MGSSTGEAMGRNGWSREVIRSERIEPKDGLDLECERRGAV